MKSSSSKRFRPTRAGIINLWDYRDQEFSFAGGRLVLRGPNGSGKTKALEVLFPFVLDGRIEPRRLNPFAGEERTMKSNLLYRKQESAHSYVWMEFCRGDDDDPEAVTVGIGMRATKSSDKVTRWYFVADGRVGIDFSLLGPDDRPLTKRQLVDELGTDAIVERPVDYRAAIDARLFALGQERYEQLINLILTLRRPQLAKNLDPKGLSQALTDGLRPLDENLVLDAARSFSDMEDVGRALEGLVAADAAAKSFVGVYSKYLGVQAKTEVEQVGKRLADVDHATLALFAARSLQRTRGAERTHAEQRLLDAERELDRANADREALQRSSAYESKQQIDDVASVVSNLKVSTEAQEKKSQQAQTTLLQRADDADRAATALRESAAATERAERTLADAADDASIAWTPLPEHARADQITAAIRGHAEQREGDVRAVRAAIAAVDKATAVHERAERAATGATERRDQAAAEVTLAEAAVTAARAECGGAVRRWWDRHRGLYRGDGLLDALLDALEEAGNDEARTLASVLADHAEPFVDDLRARRRQARDDVARAEERIAELGTLRRAVSDEKDDAPPPFAARTAERTDAVALWQLVRFADSVSDKDAAGLEAALHAANLLDALVSAQPPRDISSEQFLVPLPVAARPRGKTLADLLIAEQDTPIDASVVTAVLMSIAVDDADGAVRVGVDGRYVQGVQRGRHVKAEAEYIGATARARRRAARLAELDAELAVTAAQRDSYQAVEVECGELLSALAAAVKALPSTKPVAVAVRAVTAAAGALRSLVTAAQIAAREFDQAIADVNTAGKRLRAAAIEHRAPRTLRDIDALAAAVRHFESVGEALLRSRADADRAVERDREVADRLSEARDVAEELAEEAAIARENYDQQSQKLETLRKSLGASAAAIDADLERARIRIDAGKAEQKAANKADRLAGELVAKADGAYETAVNALRTALTEVLADVRNLAPYAQRDVLALLRIDGEIAWPASEAAWSSVDQVMYRIERCSGPDDDVELLPSDVDRLYRSLAEAVTAVRGGDAARKSTRTALTSALQDFDAQLAASGQEFRLTWDAAEGLTVVRIHDEQGLSSLADFAGRIDRARSDQELLLTDAERRILEDALLTGLAQQIHERTVDARDLIARMGTEMKRRRMSSGNTIGVHWVLAENLDAEARAVSKLLEGDAASLAPAELARIRAHFAAEIRTARAAHPERSYPEILSATLDYRRWRVFSFALIAGDGTEERLTVARHSALSGGEQSVSLHLPLFAAAHVMLSSADPDSPRLLALDEAFAGVDDNGRSELLGLSVQFDLDLFMTGYDLWITYADVPACAHYDLAHSTAENAVSATLLVWEDGELLAEHDGSDLAAALGSPRTRRVATVIDGGLELA